mgnify:CR=1 FL=1
MKIKQLKLQYNENIGKKRDRISNGFYKEITVINPESATTNNLGRSNGSICIFRFYWGSSVCHCTAWFHGKKHHGSGYGSAGGGGYCKESAAMNEAIENAGIKLDKHFGGMGDIAMREAVIAIGKKLSGKRKLILHTAHQ